jgi:hypothetical protein
MSSKPKDHTKTIATMKTVIADLKKNVNKITKDKEKADAEKEQEVSPEEHKAALDHFASQYKMAKVNKDEAAASEHAKAYHAYAAKLNAHYHSKLKEDVEQVDEISKELANRYMHSAFSDRKRTDDKMFALRDRQDTLGHNNRNKITKLLKKSDKRTTGISRALQRITNEEQNIMEVGQNFRRGNALRAAINAMSPEERKAYEEKRAEQQRKRDEARLERERQRNAAKKEAKSTKGISMNPYKIQEGKMGEKAAGDLDFNPELKNRGKLTQSDSNTMSKVATLMAKERAAKAAKKSVKEEAEQVDELNVMTLSKYAAKARAQSMDKNNPKRYKRGSGAAKAYDKIHRGDYSEETNPYNIHDIQNIDEKLTVGGGAARRVTTSQGVSVVTNTPAKKPQTNKPAQKPMSALDRATARLRMQKEDISEGSHNAGETYDDAAGHLATASKYKEGSKDFHFHMANHHEAMGNWHASKGRSLSAEKEYNKSEAHHGIGAGLKEAVSKYTDPRVDKEMKATKKEYEHRAKHFAAKKAGDETTAAKEHSRMKKFQGFASKINAARRAYSPSDNSAAIAKDYKDQEAKRGIGKVRD